MAITTLKFYSTIESKVENIPIISGNLIFVKDTRRILLDTGTTRTEYSSIITLIDESQRQQLKNPLQGFYFVKETAALWHFENGSWIAVVQPAQNQSSTIFLEDNEDLPVVGQKNTMYIKGSTIQKWDTDHYIELGGSMWESF